MKNKVLCKAFVDLDSFLEEIGELFTEKEKIELIVSICWGFTESDSYKKVIEKLAKEYERTLA